MMNYQLKMTILIQWKKKNDWSHSFLSLVYINHTNLNLSGDLTN